MTYDTTALGFKYPESDEHTRLWEHFQQLAQSLQDEADDRPCCLLRHATGGQVIATNTITTVDFDTTDLDSGSMADLTNNRILVTRPGIYQADAGIAYPSSGTTGQRAALIYFHDTSAGTDTLVGSLYIGPVGVTAASVLLSMPSRMQACDAGDYFYLRAFQTSGGNVALAASNGDLFLQAKWLRPLI